MQVPTIGTTDPVDTALSPIVEAVGSTGELTGGGTSGASDGSGTDSLLAPLTGSTPPPASLDPTAVIEPVIPVVEPLAEAVAPTLAPIIDAAPAIAPIVEAAEPIIEAAQPLTTTIAPVTQAVDPAIDEVSTTVAPLLPPSDPPLDPPSGLITPIEPLIAPIEPLIAPLVEATAPLTQTLDPVIEKVSTTVAPLLPPSDPPSDPLAPVASLIAPLSQPLSPITTPVTQPLDPIIEQVSTTVAPLLPPSDPPSDPPSGLLAPITQLLIAPLPQLVAPLIAPLAPATQVVDRLLAPLPLPSLPPLLDASRAVPAEPLETHTPAPAGSPSGPSSPGPTGLAPSSQLTPTSGHPALTHESVFALLLWGNPIVTSRIIDLGLSGSLTATLFSLEQAAGRLLGLMAAPLQAVATPLAPAGVQNRDGQQQDTGPVFPFSGAGPGSFLLVMGLLAVLGLMLLATPYFLRRRRMPASMWRMLALVSPIEQPG